MTINLALAVGGLEETVTVTGQSPLVDTTSASVGGNIGTAELSELPAMNRNYFAAVALLPGVQFSPSNQMGNDTIIASGQSSQGNNVTVDGGYNADDALGASAGAQVRTPLEAIQEFQVMTSMYDAEYGRASGVIVNAVTKAGTNQFKGVVFLSAASNALTAKDFLVKQNNLTKPTVDQAGLGRRPRRADRPEQGALLLQPRAAGRQPDPHAGLSRRGRSSTSRSSRSARAGTRCSASTTRSTARTPGRVRYLRETAPQFPIVGDVRTTLESVSDETDIDQTAVGTLTSVFGNARVNTVRVARTWEHWWHGNACSRALGVRARGSACRVPAAARSPELPHPGQHRGARPVGLELPDRG